jgi:hypothetical protein
MVASVVEANRNYQLAHFYLTVALAYIGELDGAPAAVQAGLAFHLNFTGSNRDAAKLMVFQGFL